MAFSLSGPAESRVAVETRTLADTWASRSRSVRKTLDVPARRLISITCASTQTDPRRSIHIRTSDSTRPSGTGCSGEDSSGMPRAYDARLLKLGRRHSPPKLGSRAYAYCRCPADAHPWQAGGCRRPAGLLRGC